MKTDHSAMEQRVAIFVPTLQPGGAERVALNLADGLLRRGFPVDILVASDTGAFGDLVPGGVRLISLGNNGRVLRALPHLVNYLRQQLPRYVLGVMDHSNVVAVWARWMARTPTTIVATTHCLPSVEARHGSRLREKLSPHAVRTFLRFADGITAVSCGVADDLARTARISRERIAVIPNPVLTPEYYRKLAEPVPDFFSADRPMIISVGRLVAAKNFATLIRAFAQVRLEIPSRLLILGEGEQRSELQCLIDNLNLSAEVRLPGYVANPYAHMARARVFALSSIYEGFGNVVVEALAAGIPVVATDCPGPREILQGGSLGELVIPGDKDALARAIVRALRNGGKAQAPDYLKRFQLETVVDAYIDAMKAAASRHSSASARKNLSPDD